MLRKHPRSVYFRAHKAMALCGLQRFDEAVKYYDEIVEISDSWRKKYLPTFNDLSVVTCSSLLNRALVMDRLNRQSEVSVSYDKIIEISDYLLGLDKGDYLFDYYGVLPYRARVHVRKGEMQELLKDLNEFLTRCPQDFLEEAKQHFQNELKKESGFEEIENNPQLLKLLEKQVKPPD
jgi:tetratricopeptide (TPR) repeat protein